MNVKKLREFCDEIHASAPPEFWSAPVDVLERAYNGIGPENWPGWARTIVSFLLRPFAAAALIHDFEFSDQYKSFGRFTDANCRLAVNIAKEAVYNRHARYIFAGVIAGVVCELFGWRAYQEGKLRDDR